MNRLAIALDRISVLEGVDKTQEQRIKSMNAERLLLESKLAQLREFAKWDQERIAALEAEVAKWTEMHDVMQDLANDRCDRVRSLEAENAALQEHVKKLNIHLDGVW